MDKGYVRLMRQILSDPAYVVEIIKRRTADVIDMANHVEIRVNHDPKFFTSVEGLIRDLPKTRCEVITSSSCCLVPRIRNSVLSGLSFNLSIRIQFCTCSVDDTAAVLLA